MATITINTRKTASGKRYDVRYRLGGRTYPVVRAGTFKTEREAKARRDLVAGEIANLRNPADLLVALADTTEQAISLSTWSERFLASRIDVDVNTKKNYTSALRKVGETFGDRDPASITASEIAEWIAALSETRKPGTLNQYLIAFRLLLDHVGLDTNAARDPRVKLPKHVREEPTPPSAEHTEAIIEALGPKWKLLFVTIEQGALRLGEAVVCGGPMSTQRVCGSGYRSRQRRPARAAGCTCRSGSWTPSRKRARSRIGFLIARCSRGLPRRRCIRR